MCVLAYLDRYVYPVLILLAGLLAELFRDRNTMLCVLALGILLDGIYNLVGYLCRWKHIYLCYQSLSLIHIYEPRKILTSGRNLHFFSVEPRKIPTSGA